MIRVTVEIDHPRNLNIEKLVADQVARAAVDEARRHDGMRVTVQSEHGAERDGVKGMIDPPTCGCTDCLIGDTTPARDQAEYEAARREGRAR